MPKKEGHHAQYEDEAQHPAKGLGAPLIRDGDGIRSPAHKRGSQHLGTDYN